MTLFYIFLFLAIVALIALGISFLIRDLRALRTCALVVALVACICLFFASWTSVGTKNLGVPTAFGHPEGSYGNGFHWKKPWVKVKQLTNAGGVGRYHALRRADTEGAVGWTFDWIAESVAGARS